MAEKNRAAAVTLATCVMRVQTRLSGETVTRLPEQNQLNAIVPKVLSAYWTKPKTHKGNRRKSRTRPCSLPITAPPAKVIIINRYTSEATKGEMIVTPVGKTDDHRSVREKEETKPTIAARIIAGPRLCAGGSV